LAFIIRIYHDAGSSECQTSIMLQSQRLKAYSIIGSCNSGRGSYQ